MREAPGCLLTTSAQPDDNTISFSVDRSHDTHLLAALFSILLVDANSINPKSNGLVLPS
jgi:hypothetical protein